MPDLRVEHGDYVVHFAEEDHLYTMIKADELESVTHFIGRFFPEFDTDSVAETYSKKHNLDKDGVIAMWKKKGDDANTFGHIIHKFAEDIFGGHAVQLPFSEKETAYRESALTAIAKISEKFEFLESEKIIFDPEYKKAGMVDLVVKDKSDGDIVFLDWKTNEKIEKDNAWRSALPPIEDLRDCNFCKYSLQLNTYRWIALRNKYYSGKNIRMGIIHLKPDGVDWYKIGNMDGRISQMLKHG